METKLVIFDVDGTLLDTETRWHEAWTMVGKRYGVDFGATFLKCVGQTGKIVENIVCEDLKDFSNPLDILNEARICGMQLLEEHIDVKKGAFALLERLKALNLSIAVATTTSRPLTISRLTKTGLIHYFDYILCGDEVTLRKPNPEIYYKVIDHFKMEPQNALVLEDSVVGVEAAYRANIPCIMIPDLVGASDKQRQETIEIVESLEDVLKYFDVKKL